MPTIHKLSKPVTSFQALQAFCLKDRAAFALYLSQLLHGSSFKKFVVPGVMSEVKYLAARKSMAAYVAANPLPDLTHDSRVKDLAALAKVDIRVLPVFFYVTDIHKQAWMSGQPYNAQQTINHRELAASCKPMDYKAVPALLQILAAEGLIHQVKQTGAGESRVQVHTTADEWDWDGMRDAYLRSEAEESAVDIEEAEAKRRLGLRYLPTMPQIRAYAAKIPKNPNETSEQHLRRSIAMWHMENRTSFDRYFSIPQSQRPGSNEDIHQDVLTLIRLYNDFAKRPDRNMAVFKTPDEYQNTGTISTKTSVLRAFEDWIVAEPDWYAKWEQVLAIAEDNLYLKGRHKGIVPADVEGDPGDWMKKSFLNYRTPKISLPWFFTVNESDKPLQRGFHLEMVLAEHYQPFLDTNPQHLFDSLPVEERRSRLEHIVSTFNGLAKVSSAVKTFSLSEQYFSDPMNAPATQFLDGILDWTVEHHDWKQRWNGALKVLSTSVKKNINLFDTFERLTKKPRALKVKHSDSSQQIRELLAKTPPALPDEVTPFLDPVTDSFNPKSKKFTSYQARSPLDK